MKINLIFFFLLIGIAMCFSQNNKKKSEQALNFFKNKGKGVYVKYKQKFYWNWNC